MGPRGGQGVIIVAAAGNEGTAGMGYPGAYDPVISVAASGWIGEWSVPGTWSHTLDVPDPTLTADQAETILETSAIPLPPGSRAVNDGTGHIVTYSWGSDATGAGLTTADAALAQLDSSLTVPKKGGKR